MGFDDLFVAECVHVGSLIGLSSDSDLGQDHDDVTVSQITLRLDRGGLLRKLHEQFGDFAFTAVRTTDHALAVHRPLDGVVEDTQCRFEVTRAESVVASLRHLDIRVRHMNPPFYSHFAAPDCAATSAGMTPVWGITSLHPATKVLANPSSTDWTSVGRRRFGRMTRTRMDGPSKRIGESTIEVTLMNCPATTGLTSQAVITRSKYALVIRIEIGRFPTTSGRFKSDPTAVCQATRTLLAEARKKRRVRPRSPRRRQSRSTVASIAATVMPCP